MGRAADATAVQIRLSEMRLCRPRQWGACWLAGQLWRDLKLDRFRAERLPRSRKGTRWDQVLQVLVSYRLIAPGSEWKLHRDWFGKSAMADLLGADFGLAEPHKLYACHDRLLQYKQELFSHLTGRWRDMFNASFDVLLYDLTSTYFEIDAAAVPEGDKRRHGYSRDKRPDCPQVVIALVVTPDGLPLAYEVLAGNTERLQDIAELPRQDRSAVRQGAARLGDGPRHSNRRGSGGNARERSAGALSGWHTEGPLDAAWNSSCRISPGRRPRQGVQVKLLAEDDELYVFAQSDDRVAKERAMRKRQMKWLWKRLRQLAAMEVSREEMLMKLGAARAKAPTAWRLVDIEIGQGQLHASPSASTARSCARSAGARGGICCGPTSPRRIPRCSGNTTSSLSPWKKRSNI